METEIALRLWRPLVAVSKFFAIGLVVHDGLILALAPWSRALRDQRKKEKTNNSSCTASVKGILRRKLILLNLPMKIIDWFRGETERSVEFFPERPIHSDALGRERLMV